MNSAQGPLILKQTADISNSVEHHLSRARAFGTTNVLVENIRNRLSSISASVRSMLSIW